VNRAKATSMAATPAMTAPAIMPTEAPAVCTQTGPISGLCIQRKELNRKHYTFWHQFNEKKVLYWAAQVVHSETAQGCKPPHANLTIDAV